MQQRRLTCRQLRP